MLTRAAKPLRRRPQRMQDAEKDESAPVATAPPPGLARVELEADRMDATPATIALCSIATTGARHKAAHAEVERYAMSFVRGGHNLLPQPCVTVDPLLVKRGGDAVRHGNSCTLSCERLPAAQPRRLQETSSYVVVVVVVVVGRCAS